MLTRRTGTLRRGVRCAIMGRMKKQQLFTRLGPDVVERIVRRFNDGDMTAGDAIASLGISRAQLYNLRTRWLAAGKSASFLGRSGGDHASDWPKECVDYLETLIQASREDGPNFELYADELARKFGFSRDRSSVRRYCERNLMPLMRSVFPVERKAAGDGYRRWERECYGELYQHDSTPRHIWGAPGDVQSIILTLDDAARQMVLYTDGFKMFGKEGEDLCSQFGRMCRALDINHMIAPTPQAKGKIERAMRTFQHRLVVVLAAAGVDGPARANEVAGEHIDFWNSTHANEETGEIPDARARRLVESGKSRLIHGPEVEGREDAQEDRVAGRAPGEPRLLRPGGTSGPDAPRNPEDSPRAQVLARQCVPQEGLRARWTLPKKTTGGDLTYVACGGRKKANASRQDAPSAADPSKIRPRGTSCRKACTEYHICAARATPSRQMSAEV